MQFEQDLLSEHKELFLNARNLLINDYQLIEVKKQRITTYSDANGGICHMRTMTHGIDFGFLKGVHMEDLYARLSGKGKVMRILSMNQLDIPLASYYINQAIEINSNK